MISVHETEKLSLQQIERFLAAAKEVRFEASERKEIYSWIEDGDLVKRFGFHNLGRHSLATFLMDEQENPAVVQAIMRHAKMDMTLYYSHSSKKAKRAAVENYAQRLAPESMRVQMRVQQSQTVN